uniref:Ubiquitin-like domain-containing protein n=1 Tax=Tetraselmis sp. GSL018 TaxID=582737 RepID=A0A061QZ71_9CHLO|mmetsp:Transcript_31435/g.74695  ORF Transcript_31435/g.74695 Transcript_31435/m.74695 type:complete len:105 (+) Transcript_31435:190-504(+)
MEGIPVNFEETKVQGDASKSAEEDQQFGKPVAVSFKLPDGVEAKHEFKLGHTVEYVKAVIHKEHGFPMNKQRLFFQEREMIDPLSLVDIRGFPESDKTVTVELT